MNESPKTLVKHFMTNPVFSVGAEMILEQAEQVFHEFRLTTAPVLVDKKKILGVMSDFLLLKCFLMKNSDPNRARLKDFADELDPVVTIDENEPIANAFKLMVQSPSHRIYATSDGKLVGALSPKDILPFIAGDQAIERYKEDRDLVAARIRIKLLLTELGQAKSELDQYQSVFASAPFMVHSVDLNGHINMANPMMHLVLGYPQEGIVGKHLTDLYPSQFHQDAIAGLNRIKVTGFHPLINTFMVKNNKELVQVDLASTAKTDESGRVVGTVTVARLSDSSKMLEFLARIGLALKENTAQA